MIKLKFNFLSVDKKNHSIVLMILAGIPPTIVLSGTSLLTTAPAATTEFSPIVMPGNIVAPAPIHAFLFMRIDLSRHRVTRRELCD